MNKKTLVIIGGLLLAAGIVGWQIWYAHTRQSASPAAAEEDGNPFDRIVIPADVDEATRKVMGEHIAAAKDIYDKNPSAWEAWIAIGNVRRLVHDYPGAISAYQKSLELQSNNILGHRNLAEVYYRDLQDYERAAAHYRLAIGNNFTDTDLYLTLAQVYSFHLNQQEEAEKTYIEGLRKTSFNPEILIALIEFYKRTGNTEKYKENIRLLLAQHPENESYRRIYAGAAQ